MDYRTPLRANAPDASKSRTEKTELMQLMGSVDGCEILRNLRRPPRAYRSESNRRVGARVVMDRYVEGDSQGGVPRVSPIA